MSISNRRSGARSQPSQSCNLVTSNLLQDTTKAKSVPRMMVNSKMFSETHAIKKVLSSRFWHKMVNLEEVSIFPCYSKPGMYIQNVHDHPKAQMHDRISTTLHHSINQHTQTPWYRGSSIFFLPYVKYLMEHLTYGNKRTSQHPQHCLN